MWIEIDLWLKEGSNNTKWQLLFNSKHLTYIEPFYSGDYSFVALEMNGKRVEAPMFSEDNARAIYNAFLMAIMGQEVHFESWGHIKPLLNSKQESLMKYMQYQEIISSLSKDNQ